MGYKIVQLSGIGDFTAEEVKKVDMIIYVLDARAPMSSVNPEFLAIIGEKPILYVLNKADMVENNHIKQFIPYFFFNFIYEV